MESRFTLGRIFLLFLLISSYFASAQNGLLKGAVKDSATHEAIPFVFVAVIDSASRQYTAIGDQLGNFRFANLHPGKYSLQISILGYKPIAFPVVISANEAPPALFILL